MKAILFILIIPFSLGLFGQSISQHVISTSGLSFQSSDVKIDWTVGQVAIKPLAGSGHYFTQGFEQPNILVTALNDPIFLEGIEVFPNPVSNTLQVLFPQMSNEKWTMTLYDGYGRQVAHWEESANTGSYQLNLFHLHGAIYWLRVYQKSGAQSAIFKIVKT